MKAVILALLTAATAAAHAQTLEVFESHGTMHYAMVPTNKAGDTQYMESAAYKFCQNQNKGSCRVMIWSDSMDRPTGNPFHTRYDENRLAEYMRGYGGADGMRFNCKLVKTASRCYQQ